MEKRIKRIAWIGFAFLAALIVLLPNRAQVQIQPPAPIKECTRARVCIRLDWNSQIEKSKNRIPENANPES